jgi:hypothetical protein
MKVKDLLYICDSSVRASVYNIPTDTIYLKPASVGMLLGSGHWILNEEIEEITITDGVIYLSVVVE